MKSLIISHACALALSCMNAHMNAPSLIYARSSKENSRSAYSNFLHERKQEKKRMECSDTICHSDMFCYSFCRHDLIIIIIIKKGFL